MTNKWVAFVDDNGEESSEACSIHYVSVFVGDTKGEALGKAQAFADTLDDGDAVITVREADG